MRYEFHPESLAEYEAAALYYAESDPAVAQRFVAAVEDAIDRVLASVSVRCAGAGRESAVPLARPRLSHSVRRGPGAHCDR